MGGPSFRAISRYPPPTSASVRTTDTSRIGSSTASSCPVGGTISRRSPVTTIHWLWNEPSAVKSDAMRINSSSPGARYRRILCVRSTGTGSRSFIAHQVAGLVRPRHRVRHDGDAIPVEADGAVTGLLYYLISGPLVDLEEDATVAQLVGELRRCIGGDPVFQVDEQGAQPSVLSERSHDVQSRLATLACREPNPVAVPDVLSAQSF